MRLYRYDTASATVIETEGDGWPGHDADGVQIFDNTHFKTKREAWDKMLRDAEAGVSLTARSVRDMRDKLTKAEADAATAAIDWAAVRDAYPVFDPTDTKQPGDGREGTA